MPKITNYEILKRAEIHSLDDTLCTINCALKWDLSNLEDISEKIEYHYGDGCRGLAYALYNALLSRM